jgi:hypothetical protein
VIVGIVNNLTVQPAVDGLQFPAATVEQIVRLRGSDGHYQK